jgi:prevent-host-death family protein
MRLASMYVSLTKAKRHLEKLIARALRGEEIIICRWGRPVVRLEPVQVVRSKNQVVRRIPGRLTEKVSDSKGTFNPGE